MLEKEITVSIDETENYEENGESNINGKQIKDPSKLSSDKKNDNLQAVTTEVPLLKNLKQNTGDGHGKGKGKIYTVAYNYEPTEQGRQGPYRLNGSGGSYGGGYNMGPPLDYNPESRNDFVKLVMSLLLIMLIITAAFIAYVRSTPSLTLFFITSGWPLSLFGLFLLMGLNYAVACSPCVRVPPCNFVFLTLTVMAMCLIVAQITSFYKTEIILYAVIATAVVVFVCFLLAFSSFDFTSWMLYVIVVGSAFSALALIIILVMFLTGTVMKPLLLVILIVGTLIEVVMLAMELQTVLGGGTVELSEDDYALGAFMLYISIISIFLKIVQILGLLDDMS